MFGARPNVPLVNMLWGIEQYLVMFEVPDNEFIYRPVTFEELQTVLHSFSMDHCPSPNGWTVEIFTTFFHIMKSELLGMVEESRPSRHILGSIKSTFITLISKVFDLLYFFAFQPISFCNMTYNIISMVIVGRIKGCLSRIISPGQFGFL